jgi:hypothetical protein
MSVVGSRHAPWIPKLVNANRPPLGSQKPWTKGSYVLEPGMADGPAHQDQGSLPTALLWP